MIRQRASLIGNESASRPSLAISHRQNILVIIFQSLQLYLPRPYHCLKARKLLTEASWDRFSIYGRSYSWVVAELSLWERPLAQRREINDWCE